MTSSIAIGWRGVLAALSLVQLVPGRYIAPAGVSQADTTLAVEVQGTGPVTIVFENGLGSAMTTWDELFQHYASRVRVIRYDRAGTGRSASVAELKVDSGAVPRPITAAESARCLAKLLDELGVRGPVIIVAHSMGGLNARMFAALFPERTAGLVLIDPTPVRLMAAMGLTPAQIDGFTEMNREYFRTRPIGERAEWEGQLLSETAVEDLAPLAPMPVALVSSTSRAGSVAPDDPGERALYEASYRLKPEIQMRVLEGQAQVFHVRDPASGHFLHHDNPALVHQAINWMLHVLQP